MKHVLLALIALVAVACHKPKPQTKGEYFCRDLDEIMAVGKITALTELSSTSYFVYKGTPVGFEYELLKRFAQHMGLALEMRVVDDFDCIADMLNAGVGDIIAANYTITPDRQYLVSFTHPILFTRQVLVQRIDGDEMRVDSIEQLDGKTIAVRAESSFFNRLIDLQHTHNISLNIEIAENLTTEELIALVAKDSIDYTIADENIALLNAHYHRNLDVSVPVSDTEQVAWALRQNSVTLLDTLNHWLEHFKRTKTFAVIYGKYFEARTQHRAKVLHLRSTLSGGRISPFDEMFKAAARETNLDWLLLAAIARKESNFRTDIESPYGAIGIMQLLPETAKRFGADSIQNPVENIAAAAAYLHLIDRRWQQIVPDSAERIKFVLASYNAGFGHIRDAQRLAEKMGANPLKWNEVAPYLALLTEPKYYLDKVVYYGYCRGKEPVNYVKQVLEYYNHYKNAMVAPRIARD